MKLTPLVTCCVMPLLSAYASLNMKQTEPQILCFGDSITQNGKWIDLINNQTNYQALNFGRAGRQTKDIAGELPAAIHAAPEADHVILFLGVNDLPARDPRTPSEKIDTAVSNLREGIDLLRSHYPPRTQITLVAPCNVDSAGLDSVNLKKGYDITPPLLKKLETAYQKLAQETDVHFLSLLQSLDSEHYTDGLHPNEAGDALIADTLIRHLDTLYRPSVFVIGDSISIDYHNKLRELALGHYAYARKGGLTEALKNLDHPVGANGGDSARVLEYLQQALPKDEIDAEILLINCGLHDIKTDTQTLLSAVSLEQYKANLEAIIQLVQSHKKKLIWITTTPVDEIRHQKRSKYFYRYEKDLAAYNTAAEEIMSAYRIPIIDLHGMTQQLQEPYRDHVHFTRPVITQQAVFIHQQILHYLFQSKE